MGKERKQRQEEELKKNMEKQAKRKEKREKNGGVSPSKKKNKKKNDNAYSMNRIAQQNQNKKKDALSGLGGGDLFTSLDSIANKIKKDQYEKNRIVYNSTGKQ